MKKKNFIKCLSITIALLLCCSITTLGLEYGAELNPEQNSYSQKFYDVPESHWAFNFISELVDRGAISGYPNGYYYPNNKVTRAEFARIMMTAAGSDPIPVARASYYDVPITHWSSPFVESARNYLTGYQINGKLYFKPSTPAVREDIAVAVVKLKGYDTRFADLSMLKTMFKDYNSISTAALPYVALAVENGLISGFPNGTFAAQASITRAETASILWRSFQYGNDNKVVDPSNTNTTLEYPLDQVIEGEMVDGVLDTTQNPTTLQQQTMLVGKYPVTTLGRVSTATSQMVMNRSGEIFYLNGNKVMKLSGGKASVVADGAKDFAIEKSALAIGEVLESTQAYFSLDNFRNIADTSLVLFFDKFNISAIGYDERGDRIICLGYYNSQSSPFLGNGAQKLDHFAAFNVTNLSSPIVSGYNVWNGPEYYREKLYYNFPKGMPIINGSNAYLGGYGIENKVDLNDGTFTSFSASTGVFSDDKASYGMVNGQIAQFSGANSTLFKMDSSSTKYTKIPVIMGEIGGGASIVCNNAVYVASGSNFYKISDGSSSRLTPQVIAKANELKITDGTPVGNIKEIVYADDSMIVFYDSTNSSVRKVTLK